MEKNKCPKCNKKININERGEMNCLRCGYSHSFEKKAQIVEFEIFS